VYALAEMTDRLWLTNVLANANIDRQKAGEIDKLIRDNVATNVVTAAIARKLSGFIWAIARRVPPAVS
jgi:hypothetical protein